RQVTTFVSQGSSSQQFAVHAIKTTVEQPDRRKSYASPSQCGRPDKPRSGASGVFRQGQPPGKPHESNARGRRPDKRSASGVFPKANGPETPRKQCPRRVGRISRAAAHPAFSPSLPLREPAVFALELRQNLVGGFA